MPEIIDSITGEVVPGAMETVLVDTFRDRLVRLYSAALKASHGGARVEIHVGTGARDNMRRLATVDASEGSPIIQAAWGFPVIHVENLPPDTIQVHTVYTIF